MTRIERSIEIQASPNEVFDLLTDLDRLSDWATVADEIEGEPNPQPPLQQGTRWKHGVRVAGMTLKTEWVVAALERPRFVEYDVQGPGGAWMKMKQRIMPTDGSGSRVELEVDYELPGGVLGEAVDSLFVERKNEQEAEDSLQALKRILENGSPGAATG